MRFATIRAFFVEHRFLIAMAGAIGIALIITAINVSLYVSSGASRLDLSRPGYEAVREKVDTVTDDEYFSPSGPMNVSAVDDFQEIYSKRRTTLERLDPFNPSILEDSSLRLTGGNTATGE